jgi:hypothetical protein
LLLSLLVLLAAPVAQAELSPLDPPPAGKARLVFFRSGTFAYGGRGCSAYVGRDRVGQRVAELGRSQYAVYDAEPGARLLSGSKRLKRPIVLELAADSTTFVRCEVAGIAGHSKLMPAHRSEFEHYAPGLDPAR